MPPDRSRRMRTEAMRDVADIAHCFKKAFVFGGYVRDFLINGEEARDIDIVMRTAVDANTFIRFLSNKFQTTRLETSEVYNFGGESCPKHKFRVFVKEKGARTSFDVDILVQTRAQLARNRHDFSCNLFFFSRKSLELLQTPHFMGDRCSPFSILQDQIRKKVFTLVSDVMPVELGDKSGPKGAKLVMKLVTRAERLLQRGWKMRQIPGTFEVNKYSEITKRHTRKCGNDTVDVRSQKSCAVCQDAFEEGDICLLTNCGHMFKSSCIVEWLGQGRSSTSCPLCRSKDLFYAKDAPLPPPPQPVAPRNPAESDEEGESVVDLDTESDDEDDDLEDDDFVPSDYDSDDELMALVEEIDGLPIQVSNHHVTRTGGRPVSFTISMS
jgi:predicted nucleotidyltransferase